MTALLRLCLGFTLGFVSLRAADDPMAPLRAADDERIAAMIAADRDRLDAIFSDELRYTHSSGTVDTKKTLIESIVGKRTQYHSFEIVERHFAPVAETIALVSGRSRIKVQGNGPLTELLLSHLAVYRRENGRWRFVAWQSARLPPPAPAASAAPAK